MPITYIISKILSILLHLHILGESANVNNLFLIGSRFFSKYY